MAIDFSTLLYLLGQDTFSRAVTIMPIASQPGLPAYTARGIYDTRPIDVQAMDGSIVSSQQTILDIRDDEFAVIPQQLDRILIGPDPDAGRARGEFEVVDVEDNGGGETTLVLRKVETAKPS